MLILLLTAQHRRVLEVWEDRQSRVAEDRAQLVANWFQEREWDAQSDARAPEVVAYLSQTSSQKNISERSTGSLRAHLALLNLTKSTYGYLGTYVLDREGSVVTQAAASQDPPPVLKAAGRRAVETGRLQIDWFPDVRSRSTLCFTSPVPNKLGKIAAGQPIKNPMGSVALLVNPYETLFSLLPKSVLTKTGETILVRRAGDKILYLSPLRGGPMGLHTIPDLPTLAAHAALDGRIMVGTFTDYRGVTVLAAVRAIPGSDMGLVAKIDYDEALGEFIRSAWIEAGTAALVLLAICGWYVAHRRSVRAVWLAAREAEVLGLLEATPDGLVVLNPANRIVLVNRQTEQLSGYRREELVGQCFALLVPDFVPDTALPSRLAGPVDSERGMERVAKRKNGDAIPVELRCRHVVLSDGNRLYIAIRDLTERKRMESELRKIASVVEASTDFIGLATLDGEALFVNRAGRKMVGLDEEATIVGTSMLDFLVEEDRAGYASDILPIIMRDGHWEGESRFKHFRTGAPVPMWQSAFFIIDPQTNSGTALATICRDLTQRKQEQDELLTAKRAAEAATRSKSEFLANMSHEIRTPMNGVIGMTGLLLDTELTDKQRRYAEMVRSSGDSLLTLINDILDFSKIEAGKLELEILDFDPRLPVEDTIQLLAFKAQEKGLKLACVIAPEVPSPVRGDVGRLRQVLLNLAGNALKFTHEGSVVIRVGLEGEDERFAIIRFSVEDTGVGIPADHQAQMFSPFTQLDGSTSRKYGGTGLGLAISKQLVELMGGQIGLDSEPGRGSTFCFTARCEKAPDVTPCRPDAIADVENAHMADDHKARRPGMGARDRSTRILVAEDNIVNQKVALAILKTLGYQADTVADGREALEALRSIPYDLVLMDCQMPEMNGYEATARIRSPQDGLLNPRIPIIAMTANAMKGAREECLAAGMNDYISKPVQRTALASMIEKWLPHDPSNSPSGAVPENPPQIRALATITTGAVRQLRVILADDDPASAMLTEIALRDLGHNNIEIVGDGMTAVEAYGREAADLVLMDARMPRLDGFQATEKLRAFGCEAPIIMFSASDCEEDRTRGLKVGCTDYVLKRGDVDEIKHALLSCLARHREDGVD
ncbi:MAG: response regulator [Candidatus Solibacter sp.]